MPARFASVASRPSQRLADRLGHLLGAFGMHHRVRDAAHQVLAEADLRVHHPGTGQDGPIGQVREVACDRGGADVDRDAVDRLVEARPDGDDVATAVDRDGHAVLAGLERRAGARARRAGPPGRSVSAHSRSSASNRRARSPGRRGEFRRDDLDVVEADDRVDGEVADVEVLAHDLAVDLALGRDVDEEVAADRRGAGQAAVGGQALLGAVGRLQLGERRQVIRPTR